MWNTISSPVKMENANRRLEELESDILKQSADSNMKIWVYKFEFNKDSAQLIIDQCFGAWRHDITKSEGLNPQFRILALKNILERVNSAHERVQQLEEDKKDASIPGHEDYLLLGVIDRDEPVALATLWSFLDDLYEIDPGSCFSSFPGGRSLPPAPSSALTGSSISPQISSFLPGASDAPAGVSPPTLPAHILSLNVSAPSPIPSSSRIKSLVRPVGKLFQRRK